MTEGSTAKQAYLFKFKLSLRHEGTLFGLALIVVVFASLSPVILTAPNLINILQQSSINSAITLGMTLVIISGGIDLSVGPTAALSAVIRAIILGALRNGLTLMNVRAFCQLLATSIIIIVAMLIDRIATIAGCGTGMSGAIIDADGDYRAAYLDPAQDNMTKPLILSALRTGLARWTVRSRPWGAWFWRTCSFFIKACRRCGANGPNAKRSPGCGHDLAT